jgi:hypothetical protein
LLVRRVLSLGVVFHALDVGARGLQLSLEPGHVRLLALDFLL